MENYAVNLEKNLGKKAGDTIVNTLAEKAKASIQAERVVLISVENEDGSIDSVSTGAPLDILGRLGKRYGQTFCRCNLRWLYWCIKRYSEAEIISAP